MKVENAVPAPRKPSRRSSAKFLSIENSKAVPTRRSLRSRRLPVVPSCPRLPGPAASCIPRWQTPLTRRPSVRCDFADSLLQGYFDGELSARSAAEFERHLQHCVHCAVELVDLDLLSGRLQLAQLYEAAPASLRKKIHAGLRPVALTTAMPQPLLWHWLAAAAALLLLAIAGSRVSPALRTYDYQVELAEEIGDAHLPSLEPGPLTGISSND